MAGDHMGITPLSDIAVEMLRNQRILAGVYNVDTHHGDLVNIRY